MTEQLRNRLSAGLQSLITRAGLPIRVTRFTSTIGSVWDDQITLTMNNTLWTSGIQLPINTKQGSDDSLLVEQGKLINGDIKLFCHGSLIITGSEYTTRIGIGSPPIKEYLIIQDGINTIRLGNRSIYRKVYLREFSNGSFLGE